MGNKEESLLISIVVTCYNRADMVCTALDSVWNQTYRPIELIIVDDGSKDNSFQVIQEWKAAHPDTGDFTTVARTFPNGKLCVARNRGLELAHGDYIQYVDDDDWLYPQAVETKVDRLRREPDIDLLVNQLDYVSNGRKINNSHVSLPDKQDDMLVHLLSHECLISPVLMFRCETLRRIGGWKAGLIFADDMEITCRLAIMGGKFAIVDQALSGYRVHNQVRQCTTIRERLPCDFCPKLFTGLYALAKERNMDSPEVRSAFSGLLKRDAVDFIHDGRFDSAEYCMLTAGEIEAGNAILIPYEKSKVFPFIWHLKSISWKLMRRFKVFVKGLLRK